MSASKDDEDSDEEIQRNSRKKKKKHGNFTDSDRSYEDDKEEDSDENIRRPLRRKNKIRNNTNLKSNGSDRTSECDKDQDGGCSSFGEANPQTPITRSSERLRKKAQKMNSYSLPNREDVLEKIDCRGVTSSAKKRRGTANDFVRGCSRYVTEKTDTFLTSDESSLSDFIDDDETEFEQKHRKSKKKKRKKSCKKKLYDTSDSDCDVDLDKQRLSNVRKRKNIIQSDDSDSNGNSNDQRTIPNPVLSEKEMTPESSQEVVHAGRKKKKGQQEKELDSDVEISPHQQHTRDLPLREKSENKRQKEEILAQLSAKRKQKFSKSSIDGKTQDGHAISVHGSSSEMPDNNEEDDLVLTNIELEEHESDREFVVDDDFCDVQYDSASENRDSSINIIHASPNKQNSKKFCRIVSQESDDSDLEIMSFPEISTVIGYIMSNNIEKVSEEIKSNQNILSAFNSKRQTLLHHAVMHGSHEITQLLLDSGCDKLALDSYLLPPAAYAILYGRTECLKILLEHGTSVVDLELLNQLFEDNIKLSIVHLAVYGKLAVPGMKWQDIEVDRSCLVHNLGMLFEVDVALCHILMERKDLEGRTPLVAAIVSAQNECVEFLLAKGADVSNFKTKTGGNLLHFAVECFLKASQELNDVTDKPSNCLYALLTSPILKSNINATDDSGFTPLMYSAQHACPECLLALLESGASVHITDLHRTTSLHLAAASGNTECVKLLLEYGHKLDCLDSFGWPPLLYANFSAQESCVLALMEPNPRQIFVLGDLLKRGKSELAMQRNFKVVKDVLVALANQDVYYRVFNDFVRTNPEFLEQNDQGLLHKTWRGILDFDNKKRWFKKKLYAITKNDWTRRHISLEVVRADIFNSAMKRLSFYQGRILRNCSLKVTFLGEPGICSGPKREFFVDVFKDILDEKHKLFYPADDNQYSLLPNAFFRNMAIEDGPGVYKGKWLPNDKVDKKAGEQDTKDATEQTTNESTENNENSNQDTLANDHMDEDDLAIASLDLSTLPGVVSSEATGTDASPVPVDSKEMKSKFSTYIDDQLNQNLKQLKFLGMLIGLAICQDHFINLHLSKPLVKQILGIKLDHPSDLGSMDYQLHRNLVSYILECDNVDDLWLPTSLDVINPWNDRLTTIELFPKETNEEALTEKNKHEYVELVSKHRLNFLIAKELGCLCEGLYQVIPKELFSLFTADEFSLLINGVGKIDVSDWQKNTQYSHGSSENTKEVQWFWEIVHDLKEDEKALLLKFSTGTPCVPVGGFAQLQGLNGKTKFQLAVISGENRIPSASTCFNLLKLSTYDSKKHMKDKLLIAIRHGAEGFSFS